MAQLGGKVLANLEEALRKRNKNRFFHLLYDEYAGMVLSAIYHYRGFGDRAIEAEDLLLEVFFRISKNGLTSFSEEELPKIGNYIYTTTLNCIQTEHRKLKAEKRNPLNGNLPPNLESGRIDGVIGNFEFEDMLLELMKVLSPMEEAVFRLKAIEGWAHDEIAELLQISNAHSRQYLAQARKKLKKRSGER